MAGDVACMTEEECVRGSGMKAVKKEITRKSRLAYFLKKKKKGGGFGENIAVYVSFIIAWQWLSC
jgi:hypothetical protein